MEQPTTPTTTTTPPSLGTESSLSNWAGPYVTDMLGKGQALSEQPYQAYGGPLTAGSSELQDQAFGGIAGLTLPTGFDTATGMATDTYNAAGEMGQYNPTQFSTNMWDSNQADAYMSPYIQNALNPQLAEISRQAQIQRLADNSRLTSSGAFGGSRQAIMDSESNDNMLRLMAELTGKGYQDAYESAGRMFTTDAARQLDADRASESSSQFGATHGLAGLQTALDASRQVADTSRQGLAAQRDIFGDQLDAGSVQRGITTEGIAADKAQFEEERDFPYKQVQYQHSLLDGMPLAAQSSVYGSPSQLESAMGGAGSFRELYDILFPGT